MKFKPILFNTEMSRAILDGRKTTTRRAVKPQPTEHLTCGPLQRELLSVAEAPYNPSDILWVRETWCNLRIADLNPIYDKGEYYYKADGGFSDKRLVKWHPSIHMPKEAARTFLRVTGVRVERLQDITDDACRTEGIQEWTKDGNLYKYYPADCEGDAPACEWQKCPRSLKGAMQMLWDSTIKKADLLRYGWEANPWVWVIEFERCEKPEGFLCNVNNLRLNI